MEIQQKRRYCCEDRLEELLNHFKFYKDIEKMMISDCKKYNIKCIDTSENRQMVLNQLLDEVKDKLNQ